MPKTISLTLTGFVILALTSPGNADWVRFRGPNGTGISIESHATPTAWSPIENLKWKVALPGPGSSCPIIVGDRIFVSCWTGYGTDQRDPGQQDQLRRHLLCLDRRSGETIWSKSIKPVLPEDRYGGMFAEHGYASHTPVSDGERVYAFFGKTGVIAFDMQGNQLWQASVGTESGARNWGTASSPLLHGDLLIVPATAESESLVALDKVTGKQVWKQEAAGFNSTWGSPVLATVAGRTDLVIAVPGEIWGLNPATGKLNWYCEGVPSSSFCSSAVADEEGVIYAIESGPGGGGGIAVKAGGLDDVSQTHVVWSGRQSNRISTPLVHEGRLYTIANKVVTCLDASTGKEIFRGRLQSGGASANSESPASGPGRRGFGGGRRGGRGGQDYGSPILADGKIYYTTRAGETFVLRASDSLQQLSVNRVSEQTEDFSATPAISDGEIFLRSDKHLYCVAAK